MLSLKKDFLFECIAANLPSRELHSGYAYSRGRPKGQKRSRI